jgi:hypothetical protein
MLLSGLSTRQRSSIKLGYCAPLAFVQGIDTLERFLAPPYYGDGSITAMHAALRRIFAPDGDNSRIICTRRVMELADLQGESAIFEAAWECVETNG